MGDYAIRTERAPAVKAPTLVLVCGADNPLTPDTASALADAAPEWGAVSSEVRDSRSIRRSCRALGRSTAPGA